MTHIMHVIEINVNNYFQCSKNHMLYEQKDSFQRNKTDITSTNKNRLFIREIFYSIK